MGRILFRGHTKNWRWLPILLCLTFVGSAAYAPDLLAQQTPIDALQRALEDQRLQQQDSSTQRPLAPSIQTYQPALPPVEKLLPSRLEDLYATRAGRPLTQFGYEFFGVPSAATVAQTGALQDNYVLGPGDEIVAVFRGQETATYRQRVNRDGQIILPRLNPIPAAGRTFGDFRRDLEAQTARSLISTSVFATMGDVRQLSILVTGEVRTPGTRSLSSLASPLDAILLSGGIKKTGSLRAVKLIRGGASRNIDLYSILTEGSTASLGTLREGDRIFVPPLRTTVAVAGYVRTPGIYELPEGANQLSTQALIRLSGGIEIPGAYDLSKARLESDGTTRLVSIAPDAAIRAGEVLFVDASRNASLDRVSLLGAVNLPGARPLADNKFASDLLRNTSDLAPSAYTLFAIIARRDPVSNAVNLIPFSARQAIAKTGDVPLQENDLVYIFRTDEMRMLANQVAEAREQPALTATNNNPQNQNQNQSQNPNQSQNQSGSDAANQASMEPGSAGMQDRSQGSPALGQSGVPFQNGNRTFDPRLQASQQSASASTAITEAQNVERRETGFNEETATDREAGRKSLAAIASLLGVSQETVLRTASDNLVWVLNEVRVPGPYLAGRGTNLTDLLSAAGGVMQQADLSAVEVTTTEIDQQSGVSRTLRASYAARDGGFSQVVIRPFDVVRLRPVFSDRDDGKVTVSGQVKYPGSFDITRSEKLSSILKRAGGLTEVAYPYGAIFTRKDAALKEKEGNERAGREIESQVSALASASSPNAQAVASNVTYLTSIAQRLRDTPALGRIMVTADPATLEATPELDIVLQPGDTIFIPKTPSSVTVSGEILNPGSVQYRPGLSFEDYIRLAGGLTQNANESRAFIVLPDGSARPGGRSWLELEGVDRIPPGSTIVIPRDLSPFDMMAFVKDLVQITSQLAVTAASLSVLNK